MTSHSTQSILAEEWGDGQQTTGQSGISTGNRTATAVTKGARKGLRDDRDLSDFYRGGPFQYVMTFEQFKARWNETFQTFDDQYVVVDLKGREHPFPLAERRRAQEYALRLLDFRYIKAAPAPPVRSRTHRS